MLAWTWVSTELPAAWNAVVVDRLWEGSLWLFQLCCQGPSIMVWCLFALMVVTFGLRVGHQSKMAVISSNCLEGGGTRPESFILRFYEGVDSNPWFWQESVSWLKAIGGGALARGWNFLRVKGLHRSKSLYNLRLGSTLSAERLQRPQIF